MHPAAYTARRAEAAPRARSRARTDLLVALGIVAASTLSATPPIATATLLALAVLLARAVWATAKAIRDRLRAARPQPLPGERPRAPSLPQPSARVAPI